FAFAGRVNPESFRTNWSDDARISSSVAGGAKVWSVLMLRHMSSLLEDPSSDAIVIFLHCAPNYQWPPPRRPRLRWWFGYGLCRGARAGDQDVTGNIRHD